MSQAAAEASHAIEASINKPAQAATSNKAAAAAAADAVITLRKPGPS